MGTTLARCLWRGWMSPFPLAHCSAISSPQKPLSFRFHFTAAAQASLHRPAPRTRSRATLIPLLRPLDCRKELLSHISLVSSTALIVVRLFYVRLCGHRTAAFDPTADLVWSFRQSRSPLRLSSFSSSVKSIGAVCVASRHALCSVADPTMKRDS